MSDSLNICLSCGFCCDGTVIGFVQLDQEEVATVRNLMPIEEEHGNGFFLQPCASFCDGCTIYSKRPRQCASFKCSLLESVEQKKLDFDKAVEIIQVIKEKKLLIEKKLESLNFELQSPSFYFKMLELKKLLDKSRSVSHLPIKHLELMSDLHQLDRLLSKNMGVSLY